MAVALLMEDLDAWRLALAQGIRAHGPALSESALDRATGRLLEWMLFVRVGEAQDVLPVGLLRRLCARPAPVAALSRYGELVAAHRWDQAPAAGTESQSGAEAAGRDRADAPGGPDGLPDELPDELVAELADLPSAVLAPVVDALYEPLRSRRLSELPVDALGQMYERALGRRLAVVGDGLRLVEAPRARKASGVYYTPAAIVDYVVASTVGALFAGKSPRQVADAKILDPACGAGSFLLGAFRYLKTWYRDAYRRAGEGAGPRLEQAPDGTWQLTRAERVAILGRHLYGVDIDPQAVALTRRGLCLEALRGAGAGADADADAADDLDTVTWPGLGGHLRHGNALVAPDIGAVMGDELGDAGVEPASLFPFDWEAAFPEAFDRNRPGFDVVVGNPPWGQKGIEQSIVVKAYLRRRFESLAGIFDLFRPFVEQGVRFTRRSGGYFGMVLPDIVLLKDYPATRRYLLEQLELTHIDWWGMAFPGATIDAATVIGQKRRVRRSHTVAVAVRQPGHTWAHRIPQRVFRTNERYAFNLLLTKDKRRVLDRLVELPRMGGYFEIHEGVHSGNLRKELFVDQAVDDSCRPLYFGRSEIAPYRMNWRGKHLRPSVVPARRSKERYANLGQPGWFERDKILIRRTGDHVLAAVDRTPRYASNNFFVLFPASERPPCALGLDGLCALLNSRFMTWYFRAIEPRKGRAFAELKIKHLSVFPLPAGLADAAAVAELERMGRARAELSGAEGERMDAEIDRVVYALYELRPGDVSVVERS
ncbi:TaqI-like C-terminal specificity domain-containing protein [Haliangium sp.]|uniref:TaqI-like C-terminal specificity domain-containing protein n=1 Tax=Haliangium sp. TaxID=2663208 RepID=UPI003D0DEADC